MVRLSRAAPHFALAAGASSAAELERKRFQLCRQPDALGRKRLNASSCPCRKRNNERDYGHNAPAACKRRQRRQRNWAYLFGSTVHRFGALSTAHTANERFSPKRKRTASAAEMAAETVLFLHCAALVCGAKPSLLENRLFRVYLGEDVHQLMNHTMLGRPTRSMSTAPQSGTMRKALWDITP